MGFLSRPSNTQPESRGRCPYAILGRMCLNNRVLRTVLKEAISRLTAAYVGSPRLNAEMLLMFTLDCDRAYLYAHPERDLTQDEAARYDHFIEKRSSGIPAQYITGHQEFWGLDFVVSPAVFIPRPETEHLVEAVIDIVRGNVAAVGNPRLIDVGTGSGCIAVALAKELREAEIHASDISTSALDVARANAAANQAFGSIQFHHTDLLQGFDPEYFDLVVSNPPYVGESEEDEVQLEVRKFEPRSAVFAGPTGLEIISRLTPQAKSALRPGGWLAMEISGTIVDGVRRLLNDWKDVRVINDLQSIPRVVIARKD